MNHQEKSERDELRASFTGWLEVTLYREKLHYLKKQDKERNTVCIGNLPEEMLVEENQERKWLHGLTEQSEFDFEEERLERAFQKLTGKRQMILIMLFVEEKTPKEIADELGCSVRYIYKQRTAALEKLKSLLMEGGEGIG